MEAEAIVPPTLKKSSILVIEDNADQWFIIRWALNQLYPQLEVDWIADPTLALPYLRTRHPDEFNLPKLILLDLYLPKVEAGWTILQTVKSHPLYKQIPTVILSQSADQSDIVEAFRLAGNSYIIKPGNYKDWLEALGLLKQYW